MIQYYCAILHFVRESERLNILSDNDFDCVTTALGLC
jgi:hypothetical protein